MKRYVAILLAFVLCFSAFGFQVTANDAEGASYPTFKVVITEDGNGTATITAALPEGIGSGKIVIDTADDISLISGSVTSLAGGFCNENYNRNGVTGVCVTFANSSGGHYAEGTIVFSAKYIVADGATLDKDDIIVGEWSLSDGMERLAGQEDGGVAIEVVYHTHSYDNACDTECNTCGAVREIEHDYKTVWSADDANHWHECSVCGDKTDIAEHGYDNACDTECNTCGAVREIEHDYKTDWSADDTNHWHECSVCGDKTDVAEHSYDNVLDTDCNGCGHIREPEGILGDVNNDGEANNLDAAIVLRYDAGILEELSDTQRLLGDVDRDGEITNIDASLILKYDAGIIEKF